MIRRTRAVLTTAVMLALLLAPQAVFADGTEALGPPSIPLAAGTGFAIGGVGGFEEDQGNYYNVDGDIFVAVPAGATVTQVLLYWVSEHYAQTGPDDSAEVEGIEVVGTSIGGPTNFWSIILYEAFRADITGLGLVGAGGNTLHISGIDSAFRTTGAGLLVVYDEGTGADLHLRDGLDLGYWLFVGSPLEVIEPQTFVFAPSSQNRIATVPLHVASVGNLRPSITRVTVGTESYDFFDLFTSLDGPEWDSQLLEVDVPAGVTTITIELFSADGLNSGNSPASLGWIAAGLAITPDEDEECLPCDGKVSELALAYRGSTPDAFVEVYQKKSAAAVFSGVVQPGEVFSFIGTDDKGTLGTEIELFVNGVSNAKIHTSCSQPIGPGLVRGSFEVVAGRSRVGGALCPLPGGEGEGEGEGECDDCEGKVTALTLEYLGSTANAQVQVIQKKVITPVYSGTVQPGGTFSFVGKDKNGTLDTEIEILVNGVSNTKIHTSCSQPIGPGLVSGAFRVLEGASLKGGPLCPLPGGEGEGEGEGECGPCDGKVTSLTLQYQGSSANAQIKVVQKKADGPSNVPFEGVVQPSEEFSFSGLDKQGTLSTEIMIFVNGDLNTRIHTSCSQPIGPGHTFGDFLIVGGASRNGGELCPLPGGEGEGEGEGEGDFCEAGKPSALTLVYTGDGCDATSHSQDNGKVYCDGDPQAEPQVRIISSDKEDPSDSKARIWFDGIVPLNGSFDIDSANGATTRLKSQTFVSIYDLQDNLLQFIEFHTSCSQPLNQGDQFGALSLIGFAAGDKALGVITAPGVEPSTPTAQVKLLGCQAGGTSASGGTNQGDSILLMGMALFLLIGLSRRAKTTRG